jgi:hypothetical protein
MKKTLVVAALLAGAVSGYSQGQVYMGDYGNTDFQITVWSPQVATPGLEVQGNSSAALATSAATTADIPAGVTAYTGTPLGANAADTGTTSHDYGNGSIWSIQLYAAPGTQSSFSSLAAIPGTIANFFADANQLGTPGAWQSTANGTINGAAFGSAATMAIAAWYNGNGQYTSYESALAAGQPTGVSTLGVENVNGGQNTPPDLPGLGQVNTLSGGITSFSLVGVPEPSTIALGVIGMSAFLMRLRRK